MDILKKTHEKSFFRKFQHNSPLADGVLSNSPHMVGYERPGEAVVVLQIMVISNETYLAEIVFEKDFRRMEELH